MLTRERERSLDEEAKKELEKNRQKNAIIKQKYNLKADLIREKYHLTASTRAQTPSIVTLEKKTDEGCCSCFGYFKRSPSLAKKERDNKDKYIKFK